MEIPIFFQNLIDCAALLISQWLRVKFIPKMSVMPVCVTLWTWIHLLLEGPALPAIIFSAVQRLTRYVEDNQVWDESSVNDSSLTDGGEARIHASGYSSVC